MNQNRIKVGFIGLGRMGRPMAVNVVKAGYDLSVCDLCVEAVKELVELGAHAVSSPKEAAGSADFIELMVVDDAQVEEVLTGTDGVFAAAPLGAVIAIHSTVYPDTVKRMAAIAATKGIQMIDAPVSGGEAGARDKALAYMVGGDLETLDRCRELFNTSAANIFYMGALGTGSVAKMIVQVVTCVNMLAASEAESLCHRSGLDFTVVQQLLHQSAGRSFVTDNWLHRFKLADDPMAIRQRRTEVFQKSLAPALEMAQELGLGLSGAELAQRLMPQIMGIDDKG